MGKVLFVLTLARSVALDPTTYAPAVVSYDATIKDWNTSQPFFNHGYREHNPRFTVSGSPDDVPVSHAEGKRRVRMDTLRILSMSATHNAIERVFERVLERRAPTHTRSIHVAGWIERSVFAVGTAYLFSIDHYRQVSANERLARKGF